MEELYADRIGAIAVTGSVLRIDLVSLSVSEKSDKNQPKPVIRQRVIMPVEGFVHSFGLMAQVMQQLEKGGVIQKKLPAKGETSTAEAKPRSPNFE